MASCRVFNFGYFGTKRRMIRQVEEELLFLRLMDGLFYEFSQFDVKYLKE